MTRAQPDRREDYRHWLSITTRWMDNDLYGHVNNARYLEFLEDARWELVEEKIDLGAWLERGLAFTVVNITINYRLAARLGNLLEVKSALARVSRRHGVQKSWRQCV